MVLAEDAMRLQSSSQLGVQSPLQVVGNTAKLTHAAAGGFQSVPRGPLHRAAQVSSRQGSWLPQRESSEKGKE